MKIKRLVIENFKSIERIELIEPNPFTVFVGPNGSGKSNIFEALEFVNTCNKLNPVDVLRLYGGPSVIVNRSHKNERSSFMVDTDESPLWLNLTSELNSFEFAGFLQYSERGQMSMPISGYANEQFLLRFTRLFVGNSKPIKFNYQDNLSLNTKATNLEAVLKRVLSNSILKAEIFEWLELFVPGFKAVEVDDRDELHWFEESTPDYFTKDLISDGSYNILAILTAIYQSEMPQFLCIEEPENGLHPQVLMSLVDFFRQQCEEKGHYIWLNTHSESLVRKLHPEEIILVDKREGATETRQVGQRNFYDLQMDEAWLTGALGGGLPW